jgi:hypothetical protein
LNQFASKSLRITSPGIVFQFHAAVVANLDIKLNIASLSSQWDNTNSLSIFTDFSVHQDADTRASSMS